MPLRLGVNSIENGSGQIWGKGAGQISPGRKRNIIIVAEPFSQVLILFRQNLGPKRPTLLSRTLSRIAGSQGVLESALQLRFDAAIPATAPDTRDFARDA